MSSLSFVALRNVSFAYDSASTPLFKAASAHFPQGFTGIIGSNGSGKTTLLRLLTGELQPSQGSVEGVAEAICCGQRTDQPPVTLDNFLKDWDSEACELRSRLKITEDFGLRWNTLSHGERKRAQIAHALWQNPSVLALDEPTNHIDGEARELLLDRLKQYRGVGLLVSHDRDFLDELCTQCLWLDPPHVQVFHGGYSTALEERKTQRNKAVSEREQLLLVDKKFKRARDKQRAKASKEHAVRSKRGLARNDSDARDKIDRARVSDGKAGKALRQLSGRSAQNQTKLDAVHISKEHETGIWLPSAKSPRKWLLQLEAGSMALGARLLHWPNLSVAAADRIAFVGNNGAGKSSLVCHAMASLNVPPDKVVYLPQEISTVAARDMLREVRQMPRAELGHVMNIVSRLGSRPGRLVESEQPSPGEVRKLMLARGMSQAPYVIVMDEPTNHLDLPSIEALESALKECPCALILVSHDMRFVDSVGAQRWEVEVDESGDSHVQVLL